MNFRIAATSANSPAVLITSTLFGLKTQKFRRSNDSCGTYGCAARFGRRSDICERTTPDRRWDQPTGGFVGADPLRRVAHGFVRVAVGSFCAPAQRRVSSHPMATAAVERIFAVGSFCISDVPH